MLTAASQWSPRLGAAYHVPGQRHDRFAGRSTGSSSRRRPRIFCSDRPKRRASCRRSSTRRAAARTSSRSGSGRPSLASTSRLPRGVRLDVSYWRRRVENVGDPNVLFGTTIIVPNAIARGEADGVDVRLDLPRRRGASGYLSYTNARVVQYRSGDGRAVPRRRRHRDRRRHGVHARSRSAPCRRVRRELRSPGEAASGRRSAVATRAARRSKSMKTSSTS